MDDGPADMPPPPSPITEALPHTEPPAPSTMRSTRTPGTPSDEMYKLVHYYSDGSQHGSGRCWHLPPGSKIDPNVSLRDAVYLWVNGDPSTMTAPYQLFTRKKVCPEQRRAERIAFSQYYFYFFNEMAISLGQRFPCATRRALVPRRTVDALVDTLRGVLRQPPYSYLIRKRGRGRNGTHATLAISTLALGIRCYKIMEKGLDEDKSELRLTGCRKKCKICRDW